MSHSLHEPDYGTGQKTLSIYVVGFLLCAVLTLIPFYAVIHPFTNKLSTLGILLGSAVLQFLVQVLCFLRLNISTAQSKTNVLSFVFSIVVLVVIIGGSVWIMHSLNFFMMH
jgi:cytochrome o ubiquinol oxidase operon protein cyoD